MSKKYMIHYNYCRPFKVVINKQTIKVYQNVKPGNDDSDEKYYTGLVYKIKSYERVFIGDDPCRDEPNIKGNSILVDIGANNYIFIGVSIYRFVIDDKIVNYVSTMGSNDVPFPYASGIHNTYLVNDNVYVPNDILFVEDPYQQYYGQTEIKYKGQKKNFIKYDVDMLVEFDYCSDNGATILHQ